MIIKEIQLKNFRNLNFSFEPDTRFNLILGENGAGKSNLLDAIYHLALVKTFKPYSLKNNIDFRSAPDFALIRSRVDFDGQEKELKIVFAVNGESERKRLELNTKATTKAKFTQNLDVILFAPHNINLLIGTPDLRRSEIDDFACSCDFKYSVYLSDYQNIVRNRNRLLKAIFEEKASREQIKYWDEKLLSLGSYIISKRLDIFRDLKPLIAKFSDTYFKGELDGLEINYLTRFLPKSETIPQDALELEQIIWARYRKTLTDNRETDIVSRQSQYGPHKDDFEILHQGKDLKVYGSRGQQRIATFIFKLACWSYLAGLKRNNPVILLDDIMSELDARNRLLLEKIVTQLDTQTFITTTHEGDYSPEFRNLMKITRLDAE